MFLDANVFIYGYEKIGRKGESCYRLLGRIQKGEMKAQTSTLVINEVLHYFMRYDRLELLRRVFGNILKMPNLEILAVDRNTLDNVIGFVEQGLETTDAYHAAVMRSRDIDTICSYDKGFDKIKAIRRQEPD